MDIFDYLFPQQMIASHLNEISRANRGIKAQSVRRSRQAHKQSERVERGFDKVGDDIGLLTLLLLSLVKRLVDDGVISREELLAEIIDLDLSDGKQDGKINIGVLRDALGIYPVKEEEKPKKVIKIPKRR